MFQDKDHAMLCMAMNTLAQTMILGLIVMIMVMIVIKMVMMTTTTKPAEPPKPAAYRPPPLDRSSDQSRK